MFIKKDNTLKWNWIFYGALIALAFVIFGIFGLDKFLYSIINNPNCGIWGMDNHGLCKLSLLFGIIFSSKVWLIASLISVFVFFIYKALTNENDFRFAFVKIKNSYVFYILCSVIMAIFTTGFLKVLLGRSRPMLYEALGRTYFNPWSFDYIFNSMPSGHTAVSFAGLVMIGMLFPRVKWGTWTLAILIGLSRIYVGAHWPSDVVLGAFIGMVCADIVKSTLKKINTK